VNGAIIIDNWANPATNTVELMGTNWLGTNIAYDLRLEYAHFTNGAQVKLSWMTPGVTNEEVIPQERFARPSGGVTGISVDASGKIWAGCFDSDTAVRIDPNAGRLVVVDGQTNHVGLVDMVVDLSNGSWYPDPYTGLEAHPYNYSDMTGFNTRVVNPGLKPLKGYWMVINDSGNAGQLWNRVSWTAALTNGCSIEVYVRAADDRQALGSEVFVPATNNVSVSQIRGRYIEVRLAMTRDDSSKQPVLYDLTLYGVSSGFAGDLFLDDVWADEESNAVFAPNLVGAEPMTYQWFIQYPWVTNMVLVPGATNSTFTITNVDSWLDWTTNWTAVSCLVTNGNGESLWLGPAELGVNPLEIYIPATNYASGPGPASRYPAVINVFGQPTNFNQVSVTVTLHSLTHGRSSDLEILLVSPSGKGIMLMSDAGGINNGVSAATLVFWQGANQYPPESSPIPSNQTSYYKPYNYGGVTQMPQVGADPPPATFSATLDSLNYDNPNGRWKLYIYDNHQGGLGRLTDSWELHFDFY
jgi:hypothetical protein